MNRKLLVATSVFAVALMVSLSVAAAIVVPSDNGDNTSDASQTISTSFEVSPDEYGLTETDLELFAEGMNELETNDTYLYVYLDGDEQIAAEVTSTTDSGRNGVEKLWNGWRVYLSSEVIKLIVEDGITISKIVSLVPGVSSLGAAMITVLRVSIYSVAQSCLGLDLLTDDYGGLYFDITYKEKKKILFFTITRTHAPRVTNAGFQ